jgi:hypothetical protein
VLFASSHLNPLQSVTQRTDEPLPGMLVAVFCAIHVSGAGRFGAESATVTTTPSAENACG